MKKKKNENKNDIYQNDDNVNDLSTEEESNNKVTRRTTKENDTYDGLVLDKPMYFVRFMPSVYIAEICTIKIKTVYDNCIIGMDKDSSERRVISRKYVNNLLFKDRKDALNRLTELKKEKHYIEQKHLNSKDNELMESDIIKNEIDEN